ncbi:15-hydroxyprostaglandin dehydrogenase [NAD(+)]-like [Denticeps clupeoides]|uniref:15-hydroxyprostaglandin dehydrogenase [NAD(+)] n=1 Tax=Denticeps clupeoides TaxID=299321 RepID=A0AAY4EGA6_9TELE|nr:15-hydroxyprostaglandin dehydrogenase [NAD(+)]-like [Denticeps clupeoides]XP_028838420.1 15-hydroxyprostaglandin dehydrogenase [NAD(+)]-like [Denticeps clupeoides]
MALDGKVAVVTGAAQGLGKAFAEILLQNGAKVALLDVNEKEGKSTKAAFEAEFGASRTLFHVCDVSSEEVFKDAFQKTVQHFGRVDIFCNNAGITNEVSWEKTIEINLKGVVRGTYMALEHMKTENGGGGGVIINVASMAGVVHLAGAPIYTATKHAVVGFSRAMAEFSAAAGYGVRICMLCPAFVRTDILNALKEKDKLGEFFRLKHLTENLLDVAGLMETSDVAKVFLQMLLDDSKNGAALLVTPRGAAYVDFPAANEIPCSPL